jgi:outer membrane protein assembly factor BamB
MLRIGCLLLLSCAAGAAESNWPQFRGTGGSGISKEPVATEWNGESGKNILWKREIPGLSHSSPVIWGDRIFLTSAVPAKGDAALKVGLYGDIQPVPNEGPHEFKAFCLDRKSGKILWERTAISREPRTKRHPKSTHANPTPATDGKYVAAMFGSEGLYVYDFDGKLQWQKDLGTLDSGFYMFPGAQWGFASSPVIHNGKVLIQADVQKDSFLAAFDLKTGKELWRTTRADVPTFSTPAVAPYTAKGGPGEQIVLNGMKQIAGYDPATGKELWRMKGGGDIPVPTPVYDAGLVVITNAHGQGRPIYALRTDASGDMGDQRSALAWSVDRAGNYMQTPVLHQGLAYFCFDNGVLSVYELASGTRVYQQRLGAGSSGFSASPIAAGGNLYVTDENGKTYVIALGREYKLVAENELGETVMATPAAAGGVLYVRGRKSLFAIGAR